VSKYALLFEGILDSFLLLPDALGRLVLLKVVELVLLAGPALNPALLRHASVVEDELLPVGVVCVGGKVHGCWGGVATKSKASWECCGRVDGAPVCSWKSSEPK
jgi:hypothetical protein